MANENVAKALVMSELKREGQIGYTEPGAVLTFDGNDTDKETFMGLVRISNKVLDLSKVTTITVSVREGGTAEQVNSDILECVEGSGHSILMANSVIFAAVVTVEDEDSLPGTYVVSDENAFVSRLEFAETVVPIKPEYLPGVCLPVVELRTALTEEGAPLTTEESAKLTDAASRKLPCVIVASYHDEAIGQTVGESFDAMYSNAEGLDTFFYNSMYYSYVFVCEEGAWVGIKAPLG